MIKSFKWYNYIILHKKICSFDEKGILKIERYLQSLIIKWIFIIDREIKFLHYLSQWNDCEKKYSYKFKYFHKNLSRRRRQMQFFFDKFKAQKIMKRLIYMNQRDENFVVSLSCRLSFNISFLQEKMDFFKIIKKMYFNLKLDFKKWYENLPKALRKPLNSIYFHILYQTWCIVLFCVIIEPIYSQDSNRNLLSKLSMLEVKNSDDISELN